MNKTTEEQPLVSICIPTFNGEKYLEYALDSVISQTYKEIEVVVSDDGSIDRTLSIITEFKKKVSFSVKVFTHESNGIGANWNNCIKNASGDYIKFLFQDDILFPTCVEELLHLFSLQNKIGLVACKRKIILEQDRYDYENSWLKKYGDLQKGFEIYKKNYYFFDKKSLKNYNFLKNNKIGEPSTVLLKTSILRKTGLFNEKLIQVVDFEFYYRLLRNYNIIVLDKELAGFRVHPGQATNQNKNYIAEDYFKYWKILYEDSFNYLGLKVQKKLFKKYHWLGKLYCQIWQS